MKNKTLEVVGAVADVLKHGTHNQQSHGRGGGGSGSGKHPKDMSNHELIAFTKDRLKGVENSPEGFRKAALKIGFDVIPELKESLAPEVYKEIHDYVAKDLKSPLYGPTGSGYDDILYKIETQAEDYGVSGKNVSNRFSTVEWAMTDASNWDRED